MKAALIGNGMVASTHVAALIDSSLVELTGVFGRDLQRASAFVDSYCPTARVYQSLPELTADDSIDFVIVTTPPNARKEIVSALVQASLPVLMEKPIERTLDAASEIVGLCETHAVSAAVMFQHRARISSIKLKEIVEGGEIGDIVAAEIRVPWWRAQTYYDAPGRGSYERDGGGVMITQAIHTLDLALWMMGPVSDVQAMMCTTPMHRMDAEDWAGGLLRFESGACATLTATTSFYPGDAESIRIQGTKAHAHLENGVLTVSSLDGREERFGEDANGTGGGADPMAFTHAWHQTVIEDFARSISDARAPLCSARDALGAHAVIDAMERSAKSGERTEVIST